MSSRGTLSRQLLALVTGSALVLSIPVAAVNFAISKRQVQAQQQEQVEVVLSLFGLQLRQAVWDFDDRAVHAILAGLAHFPALQSAEVIAPDLHASYTKPGTDGAQAGALQRYTLRSPDESMVIGQLNLRLDRALLEQQVWRRVYRLIFVIGVELLVLVALIFSLMRRSVTRPVLALSQHVQHMTPERLSEPAPLPADGPPNELHELGHGVTRLQLALREQLEQRDAIARTLQESESRLQLMADSIPNQLWTARPNGELDYVSRRAIDYFGLSAEQLIGNGWQAVVHADDLAECLARWSKALETGSEYHVDLRLRRHDGAYRWHAVMAVPKRDATGQIVKWFGSSTDITDRKRSEELLVQSQKMNAVGHLAGGIAHDFNNQLTVILGAAELLERRLTDADSKELTAGILVAAHRCRDLTKNLLAFSRKQPLRQEPVDVHALIQETLQLLERSIDKRIEVVRRLEARASFVRGDATQLQNALLNLALNARDAMPSGGTLELATESLELQERAAKELGLSGGGTYLSVRVSDTGIGMSRETQQQLFEPFFTTKPVGKGTGLGLASVHGTVDSHHGAITVESELGRGTTFTLYLRSSESAFDNERSQRTSDAPEHGPLRVLVIDDEPAVRDLLAQTLRSEGHSATLAASGDEALRIYAEHWRELDLVVLDVMMSGLSGLETFQGLRRIRSDVKVLLCSGFGKQGAIDALLHAGAHALLQKPFDRKQLRAALAEALAQ